MVVIAVVVRRLLHQALRARQPLQFGRYRFLEGQGLRRTRGPERLCGRSWSGRSGCSRRSAGASRSGRWSASGRRTATSPATSWTRSTCPGWPSALLQSFPKTDQFVPKDDPIYRKIVGRLIGNADPVRLGAAIGESIVLHVVEWLDSQDRAS